MEVVLIAYPSYGTTMGTLRSLSILCTFSAWLTFTQAEVLHVKPVIAECVDESAIFQSTYHAPARYVPFQYVDREVRRQFLELFRRDPSPPTPEDVCSEKAPMPSIDVSEINALVSVNDTVNSFSDRHLLAIDKLLAIFIRSTPDNLRVVTKQLIDNQSVNQKIWYYALVGALITRNDLNSTLVAWPLDATPDLYIPYALLEQARERSSKTPSRRMPSVETCTTMGGLRYTDVRFPNSSDTSRQQLRRKRGFKYGSYGYGPPSPRDPCNRTTYETIWVKPEPPPGWGPPPPGYYHHPYRHHHDHHSPIYKSKGHHHYSVSEQRAPNRSYRESQPFLRHLELVPHEVLFRGKRDSQANSSDEGDRAKGTDDMKKEMKQPRQCILYNGTRGSTEEENRLWYFREDMQINQHHWYWHQYFAKDLFARMGVPDRRGELFFFAHHSIVARYNAERLSNGLPLVTPLEFREGANIGPGYNSELIDQNNGRFWAIRLDNTPLRDITRKNDRNYKFDMRINNVANAFSTLSRHVKQGYLLINRTGIEPFPLQIKNQEGLDHLGNTIEESPRLSANADLYRSVHKLGHVAISVATDPDDRCNLVNGIMADVAVAMRDPAFYRVHALVDTLYSEHKATLPPYQLLEGEWPLHWNGVKLQSVEVISGKGSKINYVKTFWSRRRFRLEEGIDGTIHGGDLNVDICHQHLDQEKFTFKLVIDVDSCAETVSNKGTVRIFMAPRFDLDGRRFTMEETRHLMFQLDAFPIPLRRGRNTITRSSKDSSATKPWTRTLTDMLADPDNGNQTEHCGCGWPEHLYIPKGSLQGMEFDLFAMVTNYDQDQVLDSAANMRIPERCNSPYIYCGIPNRKYIDARPMGYPFDRLPYSVYEHQHILGGYGEAEVVKVLRPVNYLEEYVTHVSNMQSSVLLIQHLDKIITDT